MDKTQDRTYGRHVVQYPPDYSFCAGCTSCEVVCALEHEGCVSPSFSRLFVDRDNRTMVHTIYTCQQCSDHPCYDACPKQGTAMQIDADNVVWIDADSCIGCGMCAKACVFDPPRINVVKSKDKDKRKARKCDMCRTRPEGPACVQWCPVRCIGISGEPMPVPASKEGDN